jgi:hypothetical protein
MPSWFGTPHLPEESTGLIGEVGMRNGMCYSEANRFEGDQKCHKVSKPGREGCRALVGWAGNRLCAGALSADKLFIFASDSGHKSHDSHKFTMAFQVQQFYDVETGQSNLGCGKFVAESGLTTSAMPRMRRKTSPSKELRHFKMMPHD